MFPSGFYITFSSPGLWDEALSCLLFVFRPQDANGTYEQMNRIGSLGWSVSIRTGAEK